MPFRSEEEDRADKKAECVLRQKRHEKTLFCPHHETPLPKGTAISVPERLTLPSKLIVAKIFSGKAVGT